MPYKHLILCRRLFLLPSIIPSIRIGSNELALCISWPKYWSFSFSMSPSNEESIMILNVRIAQNRAKMGKTERKNTQIHNYSWRLQCSSEKYKINKDVEKLSNISIQLDLIDILRYSIQQQHNTLFFFQVQREHSPRHPIFWIINS